MTPEEITIELDRLIEEAADAVDRSLSGSSRSVLTDILAELGALTTNKAGNVNPNRSNLVIVQKIRMMLKNMGFPEVLALASRSIGDLSRSIIAYLSRSLGEYAANNTTKAYIEAAIESMQATLTNLSAEVSRKVGELLNQGITSGESLRNVIGSLTELFESGVLAKVSRTTVKQITTEVLSQLNRHYFTNAADRLRLDWFKYVGGTIDSTRSFCRARNGKYYHKSEIAKWSSLQWDGKNDASTPATIFVYLGGWGCRHEIIPVPESVVPKSDKERYLSLRVANSK